MVTGVTHGVWCFILSFHGLVMPLFPSQVLSRIKKWDWTGATRCISYTVIIQYDVAMGFCGQISQLVLSDITRQRLTV